jgi:uncharacterized phage-associated protein
MSEIRFQFNPVKLVQAVAYFAWRQVPKLDKLKTVKLLYFADKEHLLQHGRPILGDVYFCMPHGPVPSFSKNVIDDALDQWEDVEKALLTYVAVDKASWKYPQFVSRREPDLGELSQSEIQALETVVERYGGMDPWPLRNLSHEEPCWLISHESKPDGVESVEMPYELFFAGQPDEKQSLLELIKAEQEHRDFVQDLDR